MKPLSTFSFLILLVLCVFIVHEPASFAEQTPDQEFEKDMREFNPTKVTAGLELAKKYIALERFDLAEQIFQLLYKQKPRLSRDFIFYVEYGSYLARRGQKAEAIEVLDTCHEVRIVSYEVENTLGKLYFELQNYRKAARAFEKASIINHIHPEPLFYWGVSATLIGLEGEPNKAFKELEARHPGHPLISVGQAVFSYYNGDNLKAEELLNKVAGEPNLPAVYYVIRSAINIRLKKFDEAGSDLVNAIKADPLFNGILTNQVVIAVINGTSTEARNAIKQAGNLESLVEYVQAKAFFLLKADRVDEAESALTELLNKKRNLYYANYLMSVIISRRIDRLLKENPTISKEERQELLKPHVDKAVEYLRASISAGKGFFAGYFMLGRIQLIKGDFNDALTMFEKAAKLAPKDTSVQFFIGHCYLKLNKFSAAKRTFQAIQQRDINNIMALNCLGYISAITGGNVAAMKYFTTVLAIDRSNKYAKEQLKRLKELEKLLKSGK